MPIILDAEEKYYFSSGQFVIPVVKLKMLAWGIAR